MSVQLFQCPNCGAALPPQTRADQLLTCPACLSTLVIHNWEALAAGDAAVIETATRVYQVGALLGEDELCNHHRASYHVEGQRWQGLFRIVRDPADSDLLENEARQLFHLKGHPPYDDFRPFCLACYALAAGGGADGLALTHLDRLAGLPRWQLATAYRSPADPASLTPFFEQSAGLITAIRVQDPPQSAHQLALTWHLLACTPDYTPLPPTLTTPEAYAEHIAALLGLPLRLTSAGVTAREKRWLG
ncbi:MAG: hypothetical protein HC915_07745 [Anaerolineae bacterium]|nr:hypothetical protein [Anaerolineae bacterium]